MRRKTTLQVLHKDVQNIFTRDCASQTVAVSKGHHNYSIDDCFLPLPTRDVIPLNLVEVWALEGETLRDTQNKYKDSPAVAQLGLVVSGVSNHNTNPNRIYQLYSFCHLGQPHTPPPPAMLLLTSTYQYICFSRFISKFPIRPSPKTFQQPYYIQAARSRPRKDNNSNKKRI